MAQSESKGQAQEQGAQAERRARQRGGAASRRGGEMVPAGFERAAVGWRPLTTFHRIFDDFDRLFEDMQRGVLGRGMPAALPSPVESMLAPMGLFEGVEAAPWAPRVEVRDTGTEIVVAAELPGAEPADVQVEMTDEGLVIRGEIRQEQTQEEGGVRRTERRYGSFYRLIGLPPDLVNTDRAQAECRNGILTIRLPKNEAAQQRTRRIQILGAEPIGGEQQQAGTGETAPGAGGETGGEGRRRSA